MVFICVAFLIAGSIIIPSISKIYGYQSFSSKPFSISLVTPLQSAVTKTLRVTKQVWYHYFYLVSVAHERDMIEKRLSQSIESLNHLKELELSNRRYRKLLRFEQRITHKNVVAQIVGKDPSPWFKSVLVNKGTAENIRVGLPVIVPEGIVGLVTEVSRHCAKVLLIIDRNSAVDALIQRTRARGIIRGKASNRCIFQYVLRKHEIEKGDAVVSSGVDGIFFKGLRIGSVSEVIRRQSGIFQQVIVTPYVDFETLEEVVILLDKPVCASMPERNETAQ